MPATAEEKYRGRSLEKDSAEIVFLVRGTDDDVTARTTAEAVAPAAHDGIPRDHVKVDQVADEIWLCTAIYQGAPGGGVGSSSFTFEVGGGQTHITQSLATVSKTGVGGATAPDFKGAIGATKDSIEGVDIIAPEYRFSETHIKADTFVDNAYKAICLALVGTINNASFKGLAAGEALLLAISGSKRGNGDWELTYQFGGSPNRTNIAVGDITVPAKKGWEYLWIMYDDEEDDDADRLVKRPIAAYVEKVYELGDFSQLGIGT